MAVTRALTVSSGLGNSTGTFWVAAASPRYRHRRGASSVAAENRLTAQQVAALGPGDTRVIETHGAFRPPAASPRRRAARTPRPGYRPEDRRHRQFPPAAVLDRHGGPHRGCEGRRHVP